MNTTIPPNPSGDPNRRTLQLWRPDADFEADWFVVELRWESDDGILPTEASIRRNLLTSALPLLRHPQVTFRQLPHDRMHLSIDSPDAHINVRVTHEDIAITVQVVDDAEAAVRFCENVDATCCGGVNRVRNMPEGQAGPFYPLDSGYLFSRVVERRESPYQTITLSDHPIYGRALLLNREIQIGERDEEIFSGTMVSHALGDDTKRVLILGGGDCGVLREVLSRPVERAVMVELDPEVLRFCQEHLPNVVGGAPDDPRAELRFEDAFAYLATCDERFDVVLSDLPDTPIADYTLDDQIALMCRVLTETGTLGTHAQHTKFEGPYEAEPMIAAIARRFEHVDVVQRVVPSYQDQSWLFVRGNGQRSVEGRA